MTSPIAIVVAGLIIGAAILIVGRWAIMPRETDLNGFYRLDRWTGQVKICVAFPDHEMICK